MFRRRTTCGGGCSYKCSVTPLEVPAIPAEEGTCNVADVEDVADEEQIWIAPPPLPGACRKRIKGAKGKLNLNFFTDMQPEVADNIPWDCQW